MASTPFKAQARPRLPVRFLNLFTFDSVDPNHAILPGTSMSWSLKRFR